ncbi:hypothetical protein ASG47_09675 [Devosia sp. Leaf420]|uniref:hypothetical protein n=1 Tax=Devosia sp. Leaf420 TaxID=1736374 RepID=UPI000715B816|nr:hypothetical protein [Devosia sp. Leaf420]KQT46880.1 hypothetical protein ASG47_09675 [Devosia sp. Leaf420]
MTLAVALFLVTIALPAMAFGVRHQRPALLLLSAAILVSHGLPLVFFDPRHASATMVAYRGEVVLMTFLASMAWLLGYWLVARPLEDAGTISRGWTFDPLPWHIAVLIGLVISIGLAPGGPIGFAQAGFLRLPVETPLFSVTYAFACLGALTTSLLCLRQLSNGGPSPWFSMVLILAVFWLLGGRTQLAISGLSFALIYLAHGRIRLRRLIVPGVVVAILAVQTLSFRLTLQGEETDFFASLPMTLSQMSLLEGYALSARYAAEIRFNPGQYWDVIQQVLPRALFPEKPMQLSRELRLMEARDLLGGLTPGLAGEAFAAGGHLFVCVIGLLFGAVLALLDNAYAALRGLTPLSQALVTALIPLLAIFVLRGGFDTGIFRLAVILFGSGVLAVFQSAKLNPARLQR